MNIYTFFAYAQKECKAELAKTLEKCVPLHAK